MTHLSVEEDDPTTTAISSNSLSEEDRVISPSEAIGEKMIDKSIGMSDKKIKYHQQPPSQ